MVKVYRDSADMDFKFASPITIGSLVETVVTSLVEAAGVDDLTEVKVTARVTELDDDYRVVVEGSARA